MIDLSSKGVRCCAARDIRSMEGVVTTGTVGMIVYEMESRGRHLINVQWDNGVISLVSSREIEVIERDIIWQ